MLQLSRAQVRPKSLKYPYLKTKANVTRKLIPFALTLAYKHAGMLGRDPYEIPGAPMRSARYRALVVECMLSLNEYTECTKADTDHGRHTTRLA